MVIDEGALISAHSAESLKPQIAVFHSESWKQALLSASEMPQTEPTAHTSTVASAPDRKSSRNAACILSIVNVSMNEVLVLYMRSLCTSTARY